MRELTFQIKEALGAGLRPDSRMQRTPGTMTACTNLVPTEWGLCAPPTTTNPFADSVSWPFPQYLRGNGVSLLAGSTTLKSVNETNWTVSSISTYNPITDASKSIVTGGVWQMVDFWDSWILLNGTCAVYKFNRQGMRGGTNLAYVQDASTVPTCGCSFRGRAMFGGFSLTAWQPQWDAIADNAEFTHTPSSRGNVVYWTTIGGGDLEWTLVPELMPTNWLDLLKQGTLGFMPMPFQGRVLAVKPLGNGVMVYGEDGVAMLRPHTDPTPGFGIAWSERVGIAIRGAVAGDDGRHLFIDHSGVLWAVTGEGIKRLGYQEFFSPMLGTHIVGSYDPVEGDFRFCNQTVGYIFRNGLSKLEKRTTGLHFVQGGLVGVTTGTPGQATFTTQTFDMDNRGIKQIAVVEVAGSGLTNLEVSVLAGFAAAPSATRWVSANSKGVAFPMQSGTDFQISVRGTAAATAKIDYITVRWKQSDLTAARGVYNFSGSA